MPNRFLVAVSALVVASLAAADAQFRRGMFGEAHEITLFPMEPPAMLLPPGTVDITVRNATGASARIVERLQEAFRRQLTGNDSRLRIAEKNADLTIVATITEWNESRRTSTKYVSETRQVGTREVTDKNGKKRYEPIYEYGRNKPSVVISAAAGMRIEVRRGPGGPIADETARHTISEEHLADQSPPSRDAVEDLLVDNVAQKAAGRITPGRQGVRVLLARSNEVDPFNSLAQNRRWNEWLTNLLTVKPHRDRKRDAYRLHNLAVAHEAQAYEAPTPQAALESLTLASTLIAQAAQQHDDEKYITESADRIARSMSGYRRLVAMFEKAGAVPAPSAPRPAEPRAAEPRGPEPRATEPLPPATTQSQSATVLTNKDVIDLHAAGLDDTNLIATITDAKAVKFDLSPAGLRALLAAKVSNPVINAMRAKAGKKPPTLEKKLPLLEKKQPPLEKR